ncbi:MAG: hypothetical protein R2839_02595 [Thermomicrobiales bacterium]
MKFSTFTETTEPCGDPHGNPVEFRVHDRTNLLVDLGSGCRIDSFSTLLEERIEFRTAMPDRLITDGFASLDSK